jgi:hypothetical protein
MVENDKIIKYKGCFSVPFIEKQGEWVLEREKEGRRTASRRDDFVVVSWGREIKSVPARKEVRLPKELV